MTITLTIAGKTIFIDTPVTECKIFKDFAGHSAQSCDGELNIHLFDGSASNTGLEFVNEDGSLIDECLPILQIKTIRERYFNKDSGELHLLLPDQMILFKPDSKRMDVYRFDWKVVERYFISHVFLYFCNYLSSDSGLLLHGAGFVLTDHGAVILGSSGSGKSTAVNLMKRDFLLSDDVVAIKNIDISPNIHATPLGGPTDGNRSAPLSAIFFPQKDDSFSITPISPRKALLRFLEEHSDYISRLFKPYIAQTFKNAHALFQKVPAYELSFPKDYIDTEAVRQVLLTGKVP